jgi:hypothetical protein
MEWLARQRAIARRKGSNNMLLNWKSLPADGSRRLKFIGCEIVYREACSLAATVPHRVDIEFLLKGLHDLPRADMVAKIQEIVDAATPDKGYEAILLGYARCNDGLVGLKARTIPLIIPRAHDCITFFFGSRTAYREYFDSHPGTYFMTTGWTERNKFGENGYERPAYGMEGVMAKLGLTEPYDVMVAKYGKENADYIIESLGGWEKSYTRSLYLEMGVCDETAFIELARERAALQNWAFEVRKGEWSLLRKLFYGEWDQDFVIVPPGGTIVARNDDGVLDFEPAPAP